MNLQPTLTGELTILRPTVPADRDGMYAGGVLREETRERPYVDGHLVHQPTFEITAPLD